MQFLALSLRGTGSIRPTYEKGIFFPCHGFSNMTIDAECHYGTFCNTRMNGTKVAYVLTKFWNALTRNCDDQHFEYMTLKLKFQTFSIIWSLSREWHIHVGNMITCPLKLCEWRVLSVEPFIKLSSLFCLSRPTESVSSHNRWLFGVFDVLYF